TAVTVEIAINPVSQNRSAMITPLSMNLFFRLHRLENCIQIRRGIELPQGIQSRVYSFGRQLTPHQVAEFARDLFVRHRIPEVAARVISLRNSALAVLQFDFDAARKEFRKALGDLFVFPDFDLIDQLAYARILETLLRKELVTESTVYEHARH